MMDIEQVDERIAEQIRGIDYNNEFSVCTLVSDMDQYHNMLQSFIKAGFTHEKCEYLYINNTDGNTHDAYRAFNIFLQRAKGKYVIICHQDVELRYDGVEDLKKRISELEEIDPNWALAGNAGAINLVFRSMQITHGDPPVFLTRGKSFPQKVLSLDENFILIKKDANLAASSDLAGFHLYGTDICLIASILGYSAYVINFHLYHKSKGNMNTEFFSAKRMFNQKYRRAFKGRYIQTVTRQKFYFSGSNLANLIYNTGLARKIAKIYFKFRFIFNGSY